MKSRHAAALALAYLMLLPPLTSKNLHKELLRFDAKAPLNSWYQTGVFSSEFECEVYKELLNGSWLVALAPYHPDPKAIIAVRQYQAQELCTTAYDPRLNSN
jgi:hypothetical protein